MEEVTEAEHERTDSEPEREVEELAAGLSGFEIAGLRDRRTGKEYYRNDDGVHERKQ